MATLQGRKAVGGAAGDAMRDVSDEVWREEFKRARAAWQLSRLVAAPSREQGDVKEASQHNTTTESERVRAAAGVGVGVAILAGAAAVAFAPAVASAAGFYSVTSMLAWMGGGTLAAGGAGVAGGTAVMMTTAAATGVAASAVTAAAIKTRPKDARDRVAFVSYFQKEGADAANKTYEALVQQWGEKLVFRDVDDAQRITIKLQELKLFVENSDNFVMILTRNYFKRPWCLVEIVHAVRNKLFMILVKCTSKTGFGPEDFLSLANATKTDEAFAAYVGAEAIDILSEQRITPTECREAVKAAASVIAIPLNPEGPNAKEEADRVVTRLRHGRSHALYETTNDVTLPTFVPLEVDELRSELGMDCERFFNIGIAGMTKVGKTRLLNALRGLQNSDPGAGVVDIGEVDSPITPYNHPRFPNDIKLWDIPGCGGLLFQSKEYVRKCKLGAFPCIMVAYKETIPEWMPEFLSTSNELKVTVLVVRTQADTDVRNIADDKGVDEEEAIRLLREMMRKELGKFNGFPSFLVSSKEMQQQLLGGKPTRFDEDQLRLAILLCAAGHAEDVLAKVRAGQ